MRTKKGIVIDEKITWQDITPGGVIYEGGSAENFNTGDWRTIKPVFKADKCKQCLLCVPVCPDSAIKAEGGKRGEFEYKHCKGCGICAKVCPFDAIELIKEEK